MKPTNPKSSGCSPISSNCVIWQGPDINCINLCKGDTVSDVMFKLGCLICDLKKELDVSTYDLTCLNLAACDKPTSFLEFIQIVIDKLCELQACCDQDTTEELATEIVVVAACFSAELGPTATVSNYIQAIGTKVCEQDVIITNQQLAIELLVEKVAALENTVYNP
jgi:hypothetical protein